MFSWHKIFIVYNRLISHKIEAYADHPVNTGLELKYFGSEFFKLTNQLKSTDVTDWQNNFTGKQRMTFFCNR